MNKSKGTEQGVSMLASVLKSKEGKTKGLMYMMKPSLKTMEEPHLRALIKEWEILI